MKNVKFNSNTNKKTSLNSKNSNNANNKKLSQNNINIKDNNKITKKITQQNNNKNNNIDKNNNDKKVIYKQQKNLKEKYSKVNSENKENGLNSYNNTNNDTNNTDNRDKKIFSHDLKLSKEDLNKLINNKKLFPDNLKLSKSHSNDNIHNFNNNENLTLKSLAIKQKSLYVLINKINSERNYIKEGSFYDLSEKNIIYKNIQEEKIKSLDIKEKNYNEKLKSIQHQMDNINNKNISKILEKGDEDEQKNKIKVDKENKIKFRKLKLQNQKKIENFKTADINFEKKLNNLLLLEKKQKEQQKEDLKERIKRTHSLEQKRLEAINLEAEKNKKYLNSKNKRGTTKDYLYFKLENKSFEKKEKDSSDNSKKIENIKEDGKNKEKERKEYLNKKKKEMIENINNLHKMWKERNHKLPKYRSPLFEKAMLSEEDCKKIENNKIESKKLLYINKENYSKEKIQLPPINYLLKKENSLKTRLINNFRSKRNHFNNLKTTKINSTKENNVVKSLPDNTVQNIQPNKNQNGNNLIINISLKTRKAKDLISPNDFNYLEEIRKKRLLKSNSDNNLIFTKKNKNIHQEINLEKEKQNLELLERKYNMDKKLLRVRGGYVNNLELGNKINQLLIKSIDNKLNIFENITNNNLII